MNLRAAQSKACWVSGTVLDLRSLCVLSEVGVIGSLAGLLKRFNDLTHIRHMACSRNGFSHNALVTNHKIKH